MQWHDLAFWFLGALGAAVCVVFLITLFLDVALNAPLYWCQWRHKSHHTIQPLEYGILYYVHCRKCGQTYAMKRD